MREKLTGDMSMFDVIFTMSEGVIGALVVVQEMLKTRDGIVDLMLCDSLGIRGSKLYMLYNDCCGRDMSKFMDTLYLLRSHVFSLEEIDACLALPRAIPFIDDSIDINEISLEEDRAAYYSEDMPELYDPVEARQMIYFSKLKESFQKRLKKAQDDYGQPSKY